MNPRVALLLVCWPVLAWGQMEILRDEPSPAVFSGEARPLSVRFRNPTGQLIDLPLRTRLYQASSATLMPVGPAQPWKRLTVLPSQTVIETVSLDFPAVRTETHFQLHWLDGQDRPVGKTDVQVCPEDLLGVLINRAGNEPLGVFDPDSLLKPILTRLKVPYHDLEAGLGLEGFRGKLAIIGPFASEASMPANLARRVAAKAKEPMGIIWVQPPGPHAAAVFPPAYVVRPGGCVVVVHSSLVADLAQSPKAQVNLLRCVELALHPDRLRLPELAALPKP